MNNDSMAQSCQCECGDTRFSIVGEPLTRVICHCTICQEFNQADFGDVTIFSSKDVNIDNIESIDFKEYKAPPAVQRGKCSTCNKPAIELLDLPLLPNLTIVPTRNIPSESQLPEPDSHIFYHSRKHDVEDAIPKYSGFLKSQLALLFKLMSGMFKAKLNS